MIRQILAVQFQYTHLVLVRNLTQVSESEALLRPVEGGSSLNWVLGHILATRSSIIELLGGEAIWSASERKQYDQGSQPAGDPQEAIALERMLADLEESQGLILKGLASLPADDFTRPAPFSPLERDDETVGSPPGCPD